MGKIPDEPKTGFWGQLWNGFMGLWDTKVADASKADAYVKAALRHARDMLEKHEKGLISDEELSYQMSLVRSSAAL